MAVGAPIDNPAAGSVLVSSGLVTAPGKRKVRVTVVSEVALWVLVVQRKPDGGERWRLLLPVTSLILGPLDLGEWYFAMHEYAEVLVREGITPDPVPGTVQATVEVVPV
jgi:hypothetical protein